MKKVVFIIGGVLGLSLALGVGYYLGGNSIDMTPSANCGENGSVNNNNGTTNNGTTNNNNNSNTNNGTTNNGNTSNNNNSNTNNGTTISGKEGELKLTDTLVMTLYDYVDGKFDEEVSFYYPGYFYKQDSIDLKTSASYPFKLYLASSYMNNENKVIKKSEVKDVYETIFGIETYQNVSEFYGQDEFKYTYDKNNDAFIGTGGMGDSFSTTTENKLVSAKRIVNNNRDIIELVEVVAFIGPDSNGNEAGYKDYNRTQYVEANPNLAANKNIDKYNKYKYTYEKNSYDQYVLIKGEWVK